MPKGRKKIKEKPIDVANNVRVLSQKDIEEFKENLKDRDWRLNNLYYIKDKNGKKVLFRPNSFQRHILDNFWFFSITLKARQLGITTLFCILFLDQVLFSKNKTAGIIAHKQDDAKKFFRDKVKFAWDNLPELLKEELGPPDTNTSGELSFPNGGRIFVSTSVRSGTLQFLHISEFGPLCAKYPIKAEEIITGSINAVEQGNFVSIESTAEGRDNHFYRLCQEAENALKEKRTLSPLDFKFFFFPWWQNPEYRLRGEVLITKEEDEYFRLLETKYKIHLDQEQRKWYVSKKKLQGEEGMFKEYPSHSEEPFAATTQGTYFKSEMASIREKGQILRIPYDSTLPVETWWDLGMNDFNVILFTQSVGNEIRFIDIYVNRGEGLAHYVNVLKSKPYIYSRHSLPHDVQVRNLDKDGKSRYQTLLDLGLRNMITVKRTADLMDDIEAIRRVFSRFFIDEVNCEVLVDAFDNFRKEWDVKLGEFKDRPRKDKHEHVISAVRALAVSWHSNLIIKNAPEANEVINVFD